MINIISHELIIYVGKFEMTIPDLESDYMPPGVHDCTIDEIKEELATNTTREKLVTNLEKYMEKLKNIGISCHIIVDGSFVTSKPKPNDMDILMVFEDEDDIHAPITDLEWNLFNKSYVIDEFRLHIFGVFKDQESYDNMIELFSGVREDPDLEKGLLRLEI